MTLRYQGSNPCIRRSFRHCAIFLLRLWLIIDVRSFAAAADTVAEDPSNAKKQQKSEAASAADLSKLRSDAETLLSMGSVSEALDLYDRIIELEPTNERNFYKRFRVHLKRGSYNNAIEDLTAALNIKPRYKAALSQRAKLLRLLGRCTESKSDYIMLQDIDPKHAEIADGLPSAALCADRLSEAELHFENRSFNHARKMFGDVLDSIAEYYAVPLLLKKASCSWHLQDYELVIADTGRILKLDAENLEAMELRGKSYYLLAEIDMSTAHFKEALKLNSEHKGCQEFYKLSRSIQKKMIAGNEHIDKGEFERAGRAFQEAGEIDPKHALLSKNMFLRSADAYLKADCPQRCINVAESALKIDSDVLELHMLLGDAFMKLEEWERAVSSYRKALDRSNNRDILQKLRRAETALKQSKQKNYYKILGVSRDATVKQIKKAYREQALIWHPDKWTSDEEKEKAEEQFQQVAEAYEVLSDPDLREKYNNGEEVFENQGRSPHEHPFAGGFSFGGGQTFRFHFN